MEGDRIEVSVRQGRLSGVVTPNALGGVYYAFRGIPYAKPPVGELRFKDPLPPEPWTGVRDASKYGSECTHTYFLTKEIIGSDDCLYLNVYATDLKPSTRRAVMVWIHGGAFLYGSGNDDFYGPDYLIEKDIVLVTINYRLGALGFLNLEDEIAPGNQGLKDQVMALRWVRENISNFGGDANNVTIFGESAGGASVHYLTLSPMADGLFHKAIAQSGVAVNPWASVIEEPRRYAYQLAANLGKKSTDPKVIVDFLRTVDAKALIAAQIKVSVIDEDLKFLAAFGPGADPKSPNPFLACPPSVAMRSGVKVPFLLGYTSHEGNFFTRLKTEETYRKMDEDLEIILHPAAMNALRQEQISTKELKRWYFNDEPITKKQEQNYAYLVGDMHFVRGIYDVVNVQKSQDTPTYLYQFTFDNDQSLLKKMLNVELPGATHADDLAYLFHPSILKQAGLEVPSKDSTAYRVTQYLTEMWTNFAKTGNPTPAKTDLIPVIWEPLKRGDVYNFLNIGETLRMESVRKGEQPFEWRYIKNKL